MHSENEPGKFESSVIDGITVVRAGGELDIGNVSSLQELVEKALESKPETLIISLADVRYLDSTCFNKLIGWSRRTRLFVVKPKLPVVASLFYLLKLDERMNLSDSLEEASKLATL